MKKEFEKFDYQAYREASREERDDIFKRKILPALNEITDVRYHVNGGWLLECHIMGVIEYYPKKNKVLIRDGNQWSSMGLAFVLNHTELRPKKDRVKRGDWSREKEIALVCMYIRENEILNSTITQTFDQIFKIAEEFVEIYGVDRTRWGIDVDMEYEETIVLFASARVEYYRNNN